MSIRINKNRILNSGMTMIELVVVIAIFLIITGITVFRYGDFRSASSLNNLVGDIALTIRSVQAHAIGVIGKDGEFSYGYGLNFSTGASGNNSIYPSLKSFIIFSDSVVLNSIYDIPQESEYCDGTNECSEIMNISGRNKIYGIYLNNSENPINDVSSLDISFKRPNPDALFCYREDPASDYCDTNNEIIQYVRIVVSNGLSGEEERLKVVKVSNTGQISIE